MKRILLTLALLLLACGVITAPANASFGLKSFSFAFSNEDGSQATQAGSHPFAVTSTFEVNTKVDPELD